jgi:hypothetical protein
LMEILFFKLTEKEAKRFKKRLVLNFILNFYQFIILISIKPTYILLILRLY